MKLNAEVPKEVVEKTYEAIEIAKKTGKLKKGSNEVTKTVERGIAKLVAIAKDTNPIEVVMHLPPLCQEKGITLVVVPSKEDLGSAAGLSVATAAVAIVEEGDSKNIIKDITSKLK